MLVGIAIIAFGHDNTLDAKVNYSGEYAQLFFSLLSRDQAQAYTRGAILDLVFIHFYSSLIWWEYTKLIGKSKLRWAAMIPAGFDLIETVSILAILVTGFIPRDLGWLGFTTTAKWTSAVIVLAAWLLLALARRRQSHCGL